MRSQKRDEQGKSALGSVDPPRNFTLRVDERIRALTIGPPAYAIRKRKIEDAEQAWLGELLDLYEVLSASGRAREEIVRALEEKARTFDYAKVNALVALHNRWYPIEADLRIDPRSGGHLVHGRPWHPEAEYSADRLLALALAEISREPTS